MTDAEKYVTVGRLGKSRGVAGEIWATPLTDFPERFLGLKEIFVSEGTGWKRMVILSSDIVAGRPVLKFEGVETPEDAARLTNRMLAVTKEQLVQLPKGSFFLFDLVGCEIFDAKSQLKLGEVIDVQQYPANDVYVVKTASGREVMIPAVRQFVKEVDTAEHRIDVEPGDLFDEA